jgi:NADH-quinone oxidoreductase subunit M
MSYVLLWMILIPLFGSLVVLLVGRSGIEHVRRTALVNVLITFALSIALVVNYDPATKDRLGRTQLMQMKVELFGSPTASSPLSTLDSRLSGPDIRFALGVDGISLWLIALTALLMIPSVLVSWTAIDDRPAAFYSLMLLLEAGMIGVFAALDIVLFYVFFEFTLIPLFFMIGLWGGYDRRWAARKFFIFTLAGSVLTFLGLLFIVLSHSWMSGSERLTFSIPKLLADIPRLAAASAVNANFWTTYSPWIFVALFAGFAIKVPLFPFHTWLPLAHVEAPTAGSVLLAGVLLKIGSYGFLRFALPLVPAACWDALDWVGWLAVAGIIYGALLSLAQDDIKKLIAYSSVSHMGFCLLGLFALNTVGISGGLLQMINHGLSTGALFAMVGMLYERYHTRDIEAYSGLARKYPWLGFAFVFVTLSSIGLPGLNGFTGEILSLLGMFRTRPLFAVLGLTGIIIGAWYMLWLVQRTFFGRLREPILDQPGHAAVGTHDHHELHDLSWREILALAPVAVMILWIGLFPQFFLDRMEPSIQQVVAVLEKSGPDQQTQLAKVTTEHTKNMKVWK